ncbi:MAG TPA: M56 family metallopeptidase [Pirellulales bacterium]|nr:M56 family metallopeptidase [Pirellulales bacterium]
MLWWIVQNAVVTAVLAAIAAIVCRTVRLSPAIKHALWLLVLVKLITPPFACYRIPRAVEARFTSWMAQAWPLQHERVVRLTESSSRENHSDAIPFEKVSELFSVESDSLDEIRLPIDGDFQSLPARHADVAAETPVTVAIIPCAAFDHFQSARWIVAIGWLFGAVPLTILQSIRLIRLWRFVTCSQPTPAWLEELVRQAAEKLSIRPPRVVVTPALCSPLVCALGRPRLLWPESLGDHLTHEARQAVLLHELAHLRRRDHWVAWLELMAGVLWWFNPLYWYVRHQLRENAELACDAWVVGLLPTGRRAYAQALIEVTEFVSLAAAVAPAVAMGNVARRTLERRLTMILRERTAYRVPLAGAALIGLSLLVVLPGWSGGQDATPRPDQGPYNLPTVPASTQVTADAAPTALPEPVLGASDVGITATVAEQPNPTNHLSAAQNAAPNAAGHPANSGGEDRIRELEAKLTQLLQDVQALRVGAASQGTPQVTTTEPVMTLGPAGSRILSQAAGYSLSQAAGHPLAFQPRTITMNAARSYVVHREDDIVTLTRAKYKLPDGAASALAAIVKDFVKKDIEARVEGETLTVIASEEDQARIRAFVVLLREDVNSTPSNNTSSNATQGRPGSQSPTGNDPYAEPGPRGR